MTRRPRFVVVACLLLSAHIAYAQRLTSDCDIVLETSTGKTSTGSLAGLFQSRCTNGLLMFDATSTSSSSLSVNLMGEYSYTAPATPSFDSATLSITCDSSVICPAAALSVMAMQGDAPTPPPTTTATTTAATIPITQPPTTFGVAGACPSDFYMNAVGGKVNSGNLQTTDLMSLCTGGLITFSLATFDSSNGGSLGLNLMGEYTYSAPNKEVVDTFDLDVSCNGEVMCHGNGAFFVTTPATTPAPTTMPPTAAPIPQCTGNLFFKARTGQKLEASFPKIGTCSNLQTFEINTVGAATKAMKGSVTTTLMGDFTYTAPQQEVVDSFDLVVSCNGNVQCTAVPVVAVSRPLATPVPTTAAPPTPPPTMPQCTEGFFVVVPVGEQKVDEYKPKKFQCDGVTTFAAVDQPAAGSLTLHLTGGYTYAAPAAQGVQMFKLRLSCNGVPQCDAKAGFFVTMTHTTTAAPTAAPVTEAPCELKKFVTKVATDAQIDGQIATPAELAGCSQPVEYNVADNVDDGVLVLTKDGGYAFDAPSNELVDTFAYTARCPTTGRVCHGSGAFFVFRPLTTATTTAIHQTVPPVTAAPQLPSCNVTTLPFTIPLGAASVAGDLHRATVGMMCDGIPTYKVSQQPASGNVSLALRGHFTFSGSNDDSFTVVASCSNEPRCTTRIAIVVATPAPSTPAPPTQAPAQLPACRSTYYYNTVAGESLSTTLRNRAGQPDGVLSFSMLTSTTLGKMVLESNGDYTYVPPAVIERTTWDTFTFLVAANGKSNCQTMGYIEIKYVKPTEAPTTKPSETSAPQTGGGSVSKFITCQGTCNRKAWKASEGSPNVWDNTADRQGGYNHVGGSKPATAVDDVTMTYDNGIVTVVVNGDIGNVAARFPTLEPVEVEFGEDFTGKELAQRVSASSTGFDTQCLDKQHDWGFADDVWVWDNETKLEGHVGKEYNKGSSWYLKFGGKHNECDVFNSDPCMYAPLLTPRENQDISTTGVWTLEVDGCNTRWIGKFDMNAIRTMKDSKGERIWKLRQDNVLEATIYNQAVKPASWFDPPKGVVTQTTAHQLTLKLFNDLDVKIVRGNKDAFAIDHQFEIRSNVDTGDMEFDLNLLFYPVAPNDRHRGHYFADRHVSGYRWIRQEWTSPTHDECPTCRGTKRTCTGPQNVPSDAYRWGTFPANDCDNGAGLVTLEKGPETAADACKKDIVEDERVKTVEDHMSVFGVAGISQAGSRCSKTYQNITLHGVVRGSGRSWNTAMNLDGSITLELFMDMGNTIEVEVARRLFVKSSSSTGIVGSTTMCRASPYWPVFDPVVPFPARGSVPDAPHYLYSKEERHRNMCAVRDETLYGPTEWATVLVHLDDVDRKDYNIRLQQLFVRYDDSQPIFLANRDDANTKDLPVDSKDGVWWGDVAAFLNFRDLSDRVEDGDLLDNATKAVVPNVDYAYAFTPGAMDVDGLVHVYGRYRVTSKEDSGDEHFVMVRNVFRTSTGMTPFTRMDKGHHAEYTVEEQEIDMAPFLVACAGLGAVLFGAGVLTMFSDTTRKLIRLGIPMSKKQRRKRFGDEEQDGKSAASHV